MKYRGGVLFSFVLACLISALAFAQNPIPNPGFENWTGGNPDGWQTTNAPGFTPITQSSNGHSGSSAMRGEVINAGGFSILPQAISGADPNKAGFPVSQRYARLTGFYQFNPMGIDSLSVIVLMTKNGQQVGSGGFNINNPAPSYTQFTINIQYLTGEVPDTSIIIIAAGLSTGGTPGTVFLIDDLQFEGVVGIEDEDENGVVQEFALKPNFPNPFNPTTNIEFSIPQSFDVKLMVYNQLGQTVATLVNERLSTGSYSVDWNAGDMPSGVYFYRMTAGDFTQTRKLVLMK